MTPSSTRGTKTQCCRVYAQHGLIIDTVARFEDKIRLGVADAARFEEQVRDCFLPPASCFLLLTCC